MSRIQGHETHVGHSTPAFLSGDDNHAAGGSRGHEERPKPGFSSSDMILSTVNLRDVVLFTTTLLAIVNPISSAVLFATMSGRFGAASSAAWRTRAPSRC